MALQPANSSVRRPEDKPLVKTCPKKNRTLIKFGEVVNGFLGKELCFSSDSKLIHWWLVQLASWWLTSQACSKGCPKPGSRRFSSKKAWANLWWVFLGRFADGLMVVNQLLNCSQLCKCRPSDGWHRNENMARSGVKIESGKKNGSISISQKVIAQEVSPTTFFSMYLTVYAQN